MPTYHHGWLAFEESNGNVQEVFNHARTAAYLQTSQALGCGTVYGVLDDGGCAGYTWNPCATNADGSLLTQTGGPVTTELGEPIALESGDLVVPDWLGYWDARAVSPSGPTNLGTAGDALNATNEGLSHVNGAAAWFPGSAGNALSFTVAVTSELPVDDFVVSVVTNQLLSTITSGNGTDDPEFYGETTSAGGGQGWTTRLDTSAANRPLLTWHNGTSFITAVADADPPADAIGFRITATGGFVTFHTTADGTVWSQLGSLIADSQDRLASASDTVWIGSNDNTAQFLVGTIASIDVTRSDSSTVLFEFDAGTDLVDAAAATVTASSGQVLTVGRAASSVATVLVPSGHSVLVNPDETVAANRLTVPSDDAFDVASGEEVVVVTTIQLWNTPVAAATFPWNAGTNQHRIRTDSTARTRGELGTVATSLSTAITGGTVVLVSTGKVGTAGTRYRVYDSTGLVEEETAPGTPVAMTSAAVVDMMSLIPGTWSSAAFNKGVGVLPTDDEMLALASAFLAPTADPGPVAPDGWCQDFYSTPAVDGAPWYNSNYPESAEALGFWVTEWTGLDSGHVSRQVTNVGAYRGGGQFGATGASARTMGFEVILLGESEKALEYLFRWLETTISSVCATCATDSVLIRRFCPDGDVSQIDEGLAELREVGMVQSLQWGAPPVEQAGCFIRRVNFTMAAADPCMYSACAGEVLTQAALWNDCFDPANIDPARAQCRPACSEMESVCRTVFDYTIDSPSASAPRITLTAPPPATVGIVGVDTVESTSMPVRIRTYRNDLGLTPDQLCGAPLLAELYVTGLPAYSELLYDIPGRTVKYRDPGTGDWINGYAFIEANDPGIPRFAALGCGDFTTIIEPSNYCLTAKTQDVTINGDVNSMSVGFDEIYLGGAFTSSFGRTTNYIEDVSTDGMRSGNFNVGGTVGATAEVQAVLVDADQKLLVGGDFVSIRGVTQNGMARLWPNGTLDETFNTGGTIGVAGGGAEVWVWAVQADGKILIGGDFTSVRGTTVNNLARLETDGTVDTTFNTGGTIGVNGLVHSIVIQDDGKILVGGAFLAARGTTVNRIARLETDGTVDTTYNTGGTVGVDGTVWAIALQTDGRAVVGGAFTAARGTAGINRIIRLNNDGSIDGSYDVAATTGVDGIVYAVGLQSDDKIVIGGAFAAARGTTVNKFARLESDGALDAGFNIGGTIGANGDVFDLIVQSDGDILIGGAFTTVRGTAAERLARLNTDGTFDSDFQRATGYTGMTVPPEMALSVQERMGCA